MSTFIIGNLSCSKGNSKRITSQINEWNREICCRRSTDQSSAKPYIKIVFVFFIYISRFNFDLDESDLAELRSRSITNDLDPAQFFSNELSEAIREIRAEHESNLQNRRNELQSNYSILVNEVLITTQQRDPNPSFDDQQRRQVEHIRHELVDTQNRNNLLRNRNQEMMNRIAELQRQIKETDLRGTPYCWC